MKIAIPVDKDNIDTNASDNFGRAPYYLIYDSDTEKSEFVENTAAMDRGGAGIRAAQILVDNNVEILLAPRCGENAHGVLFASNIKIYKSQPGKAMENIEKFIAGDLDLLDHIHEGFHGGK